MIRFQMISEKFLQNIALGYFGATNKNRTGARSGKRNIKLKIPVAAREGSAQTILISKILEKKLKSRRHRIFPNARH